MKVVSTSLMEWEALDDHSFGTVLSDSEGAAIRQQVPDLLVVHLKTITSKAVNVDHFTQMTTYV